MDNRPKNTSEQDLAIKAIEAAVNEINKGGTQKQVKAVDVTNAFYEPSNELAAKNKQAAYIAVDEFSNTWAAIINKAGIKDDKLNTFMKDVALCNKETQQLVMKTLGKEVSYQYQSILCKEHGVRGSYNPSYTKASAEQELGKAKTGAYVIRPSSQGENYLVRPEILI